MECRLINTDDETDIIPFVYGQMTLLKGENMDIKTFSIEVRNQTLFGNKTWINMQTTTPTLFSKCGAEIYDGFRFAGDNDVKSMIILENKSDCQQRHS